MQKTEIFDWQENFKFAFEHSHYNLPTQIEATISENWNANIKINPHLFNGNLVCLKEQDTKNTRFIFYLTDYAHFLASFQNKIPREYQCRNLYVSALLETSDNFVHFGKMGTNSFDSGRYQFIGGGIDLNFIHNNEIQFSECITNELYEELGLNINDNKDIDYLLPKYPVINEHGSISIVYKVRLKLTSAELHNQLTQYNTFMLNQNKSSEVEKLITVTQNDYKIKLADILKNNNHIDSNLHPSLETYFENNLNTIKNINK